MESNNFIIVIIIIIVIFIIIIAIVNRKEEITHHHAKPHFDQPKNVIRIKTSRHIANYKAFKRVTNDHRSQSDPEEIETAYKGHEPDLSNTKDIEIGSKENTVKHGTNTTIVLLGDGIDHDCGQLFIRGTTVNGGIEDTPIVTFNNSPMRKYIFTFPAGTYETGNPDTPNPAPIISNLDGTSGLNTFHVCINKGSAISITNFVISLEDNGKIDEENFLLFACGLTGIQGGFICNDIDMLTGYGQIPNNVVIGVNDVAVHCFSDNDPCVSDALSVNGSLGLNFTGVGSNPFELINPITLTLAIDESSINQMNPCGTKKCSFL